MDVLIDEYLAYLESDKKVSANTLDSYRRDILKYSKYLEGQHIGCVRECSNTTILNYLLSMQKQGMASSTISRNLASLRSLYRFLLQKQYLADDPTQNIHGFKSEKKLPQILTSQEVEVLLEQPKCKDFKGYRDRAMLELLYATGMRVSELISLRISDLNLEVGFINCTHHGQERVIPIYSVGAGCNPRVSHPRPRETAGNPGRGDPLPEPERREAHPAGLLENHQVLHRAGRD